MPHAVVFWQMNLHGLLSWGYPFVTANPQDGLKLL